MSKTFRRTTEKGIALIGTRNRFPLIGLIVLFSRSFAI